MSVSFLSILSAWHIINIQWIFAEWLEWLDDKIRGHGRFFFNLIYNVKSTHLSLGSSTSSCDFVFQVSPPSFLSHRMARRKNYTHFQLTQPVMWPSRATAILLILQIKKLKLREAQGHAGLVTEDGLELESFPSTGGLTTSPFPLAFLPHPQTRASPSSTDDGSCSVDSQESKLFIINSNSWTEMEFSREWTCRFTAVNHSSWGKSCSTWWSLLYRTN